MIRNDPFLRLGNVHDTFLKEFADCVQKFLRLFIALGGTTSMQQHQRALGTIPDISEQVRPVPDLPPMLPPPQPRALTACPRMPTPPARTNALPRTT